MEEKCEKHDCELSDYGLGLVMCSQCRHEDKWKCRSCNEIGSGVDRYSYGIFAGRYCERCWDERRKGYLDEGNNDRPTSDLDEVIESDGY